MMAVNVFLVFSRVGKASTTDVTAIAVLPCVSLHVPFEASPCVIHLITVRHFTFVFVVPQVSDINVTLQLTTEKGTQYRYNSITQLP